MLSNALTLVTLLCIVQGCALQHPARMRDASRDGIETGADAADVREEVPVDVTVPVDIAADAPCPGTQVRCAGVCTSLDQPGHCAACATDCRTLPNVDALTVGCTAGVCDLAAACRPGFANCDGMAGNGCETNVMTSTQCGACNAACPPLMPNCAPMTGVYRCINTCPTGTMPCVAASCIDTSSNPSHCGGCGNACAAMPGSAVNCSAGVCRYACATGWHMCVGGCAMDSSIAQCGAACARCAVPSGGSVSCTGGVCVLACPPGSHICGGNRCESDASTTYCGPTCMACAVPPNATAVCSSGRCDFNCNAGSVRMGSSCMTSPSACGNRMLDAGETCDDGNATANDGCTNCLLDAVASDGCPGTPVTIHTGVQWYSGTTAGATDTYNSCGAMGADRMYLATMGSSGTVRLELFPAPGVDLAFQVRTVPCAGNRQLFCANAGTAGVAESAVSPAVSVGETYLFVIDTVGATSGAFTLRVTM